VQSNNADSLKILGTLYARSSASETAEKSVAAERKEKARQYLMKAAELTPDDFTISIDLAVLLQRSDFAVSLL
jgi:TPR repeat protein